MKKKWSKQHYTYEQEASNIIREQDVELKSKVHETEKVLQQQNEENKKLKQENERLQRSNEELQRSVEEKEIQINNQTEVIRTLESRVQESEQAVLEVHEHETELERELQATQLKLSCSDQVFHDIFQRLLGQIPQSQPHWVLQRSEIHLTEEELGAGAWAIVKVALFRGQRVAAKCLHHQIISAHNVRLFTREMNMAAQARHPNMLQFIGATMDNNPIILTELMPTCLRHVLEQGIHLSGRQIIAIASDVARALNYLHLTTPDPIIHRDVSSANVLLRQFGDEYEAKVSDYGSANFTRYTTTAGPGNPMYSAPEVNNPKLHTPKMDVYSFGLLLVEMCSGELFDDHEELIYTRISDWQEMVGLIRLCIRQDPRRRPSMSDIIAQLEGLPL